MPELQEVFRMATQKVDQEPGALERQVGRQRRSARNRRIGAFAAVTVLVAGSVAAYALTRGGTEGVPADRPPTSIQPGTGSAMVDLTTGQSTPLPTSIAASGTYYAVSPDHTRLAYNACCSGTDHLYVANVDGTQEQQISATGWGGFGAQWSPDGSQLVYQQRHAPTRELGNLFVQDVVTGRRTRLTNFDQTQRWDWWLMFPSFAPDGRSVLFQLPRGDSHDSSFDLWSVPVAGGTPTIVQRDAGWGGYAPDGSSLAYLAPVSGKDFAGGKLWITSLDGGAPRAVGPRGRLSWLRWSPDGTRISYRNGGSIYVTTVDTGSAARVASGRTAEWFDDHTLIVGPGGS
jgi:Tol biopolymer transport system component